MSCPNQVRQERVAERLILQHLAGKLACTDVALEWGRLATVAQKSGRPVPVVDGLLLATAQAQGLTFVTRNTKDVEARGVAVLNPYSTP